MSCMNSLLQQTFLCSWFRMIIYLTTASDDIAVSFRPLREEFLFLNHRGFPKPNHCQTRVNLTEKPSNLFGIHFSLFFLPGYTHLHLQCIYGTSSIIELPPAAFGSSAEAAFGSSALTAEKAPAPSVIQQHWCPGRSSDSPINVLWRDSTEDDNPIPSLRRAWPKPTSAHKGEEAGCQYLDSHLICEDLFSMPWLIGTDHRGQSLLDEILQCLTPI